MRKLRDRIRNECTWKHLGVASIDDKLRGTCLRWFELVQCRSAMTPVNENGQVEEDMDSSNDRYEEVQLIQGFGLGQTGLLIVARIDLKNFNLSKDLAQYRLELQNKIHVADPNIIFIRYDDDDGVIRYYFVVLLCNDFTKYLFLRDTLLTIRKREKKGTLPLFIWYCRILCGD